MHISLPGKEHPRRAIPGTRKSMIFLVAAFLCSTIGLVVWVGVVWGSSIDEDSTSNIILQHRSEPRRRNLKIAFAGNSIIFIHDGPGLLVAMLEASGDFDTVEYDACLSPGASLVTLWRDYTNDPMISGGCFPQFSTTKNGTMTMERLLVGDENDRSQHQLQQRQQPKKWDFVIMNDQTRAPALIGSRHASLRLLKSTYAPKLYQAGATPIFLQTAAYRTEKARTAIGMGSFESFTQKLTEGYHDYANILTEYFALENRARKQQALPKHSYPSEAFIAPVGSAYAYLQHNPGKLNLFDKLYLNDDVHPSPYGTWLQCCILYSTMSGKAPPPYSTKFWNSKSGRDRTHYPIPSSDEGRALRDVAWQSVRIMWRASKGVTT